MKLFIASDHAGVEFKTKAIHYLKSSYRLSDLQPSDLNDPLKSPNNFIQDLGPFDNSSVDYPDFAHKLCKTLMEDPSHTLKGLKDNTYGILICGSGQGMSMTANKYSTIRAALCWSEEVAKLAREHNNANILCLSARLIDSDLNLKIIDSFLKTNFAQGRHQNRIDKINC